MAAKTDPDLVIVGRTAGVRISMEELAARVRICAEAGVDAVFATNVTTPEHVQAYLEAAFEDGSETHILRALNTAARAIGMTEVARRTGLTREEFYRSCVRMPGRRSPRSGRCGTASPTSPRGAPAS